MAHGATQGGQRLKRLRLWQRAVGDRRRGQEVIEARALAGGHVARNRRKEVAFEMTGSVRLRTMPAWVFT